MGYYDEQQGRYVLDSIDEASGYGKAGTSGYDTGYPTYDLKKAGKLEAAEHILAMWNEAWPVTQLPFHMRLKEYAESLK